MRLSATIARALRATTPASYAALAVTLALAVSEARWLYATKRIAYDLKANTWQPARDVLAGVNPYPDPSVVGFVPESVYPPLVFLVTLPLGLLTLPTAWVIWGTILLGSALATLKVLDVRDWRLYVLYGSSAPVMTSVLWGNVTVLLTLLLALVWRYRNRDWAGWVLAVAVASKLLAAPVVAWFVLTRRPGIWVRAVIATPIVILGFWAMIGFAGLDRYPDTLAAARDAYAGGGQGLQALVHQLGAGHQLALIIGCAVASVCLVLAWRAMDEVASFTFVLCATLALAPLSWVHYFSFFVIPLAARYPRLGAAWLPYAALWVASPHSLLLRDHYAAMSVAVLCLTFVLVVSLSAWRPSRSIALVPRRAVRATP